MPNNTPTRHYPYPTDAEPADAPLAFNNLAVAVENDQVSERTYIDGRFSTNDTRWTSHDSTYNTDKAGWYRAGWARGTAVGAPVAATGWASTAPLVVSGPLGVYKSEATGSIRLPAGTNVYLKMIVGTASWGEFQYAVVPSGGNWAIPFHISMTYNFASGSSFQTYLQYGLAANTVEILAHSVVNCYRIG